MEETTPRSRGSFSEISLSSLHDLNRSISSRGDELKEQYLTASERTQAASRWTLANLARGIGRTAKDFFWSSRITTLLVWAAIGVGVLFAVVSNPAGWMIAAAAVAGLFLKFLSTTIYDKIKTGKWFWTVMTAEISAVKWRFKSQESRCSGIPMGMLTATDRNGTQHHLDSAVVYLTAAPNQRDCHLERICYKSNFYTARPIQTIISVQEPWEMEVAGMTAPDDEKDLAPLGIKRVLIPVVDHHYPTPEQLDKGADAIFDDLVNERNVVIHCKAGQGRSAMIVAAFLIKYCGMTAEQARKHIENYRDTSTIANKLEDKEKDKKIELGLRSYEARCRLQPAAITA